MTKNYAAMKKFVYLCGMMLLNLNMLARIDNNWTLIIDCDNDVTIRNVSGITGFQPGVKHTIAMGTSGDLIVPDTTNIVFRASEHITIDNEFTIPVGAKVSMIMQECPETE